MYSMYLDAVWFLDRTIGPIVESPWFLVPFSIFFAIPVVWLGVYMIVGVAIMCIKKQDKLSVFLGAHPWLNWPIDYLEYLARVIAFLIYFHCLPWKRNHEKVEVKMAGFAGAQLQASQRLAEARRTLREALKSEPDRTICRLYASFARHFEGFEHADRLYWAAWQIADQSGFKMPQGGPKVYLGLRRSHIVTA